MVDENASPLRNDPAMITVCNDKSLRKPLARKAADALKLSRRRSVLDFFNRPKENNTDDKLQEKWFNTMVKNTMEDQSEPNAGPRLSFETPEQKSPGQRMMHLMGSLRHKRHRTSGFTELSAETSKSPHWASKTLRTKYENGSVTISSPVQSSPVHHSSPIPIPEQTNQSTFAALSDTFNSSDSAANYRSRQFLSELNFGGSSPFDFTPEIMTPTRLRDESFSPLSGTVFPLEDTQGSSQPRLQQCKEIYKEQGHMVCDALGGTPHQLAGISVENKYKQDSCPKEDARGSTEDNLTTSMSYRDGKIALNRSMSISEDPFLISSPFDSNSVRDDLSSMRLGGRGNGLNSQDNYGGSGGLGKCTVEDDETESRSAWREFLAESKGLLQRRWEHSERTASEYPTLKALREGLSKHRLNMKGLLHRGEDQLVQASHTLQAKLGPAGLSTGKDEVDGPVEYENARCSSDNDTLKEVSSLKHQDSTVRLIQPSSPKDSFDLKRPISKMDLAPRSSRSTPRSSLDIPSVDLHKVEEKVGTEFALDRSGIHPVKWSKAPAAQSWYTESLNSESWKSGRKYNEGHHCRQLPPHARESSDDSDESVQVRRVWRRPTSLDSVLSETTSVGEDDVYDDRSLVNAIMGVTRNSTNSVD